jgi:hypothetical protein
VSFATRTGKGTTGASLEPETRTSPTTGKVTHKYQANGGAPTLALWVTCCCTVHDESDAPEKQKKRSLPRGWTHPITPTEVREQLPRVASVYWVDLHTLLQGYRPEHWVKVPHFSLQWDPTSPRLQPRLSVRAVPTESRREVRAWFQDSVVS